MLRTVVILGVVLLLAGGLYCIRDSLGAVASVVEVANNLSSASDKKADPGNAAPAVAAKRQPLTGFPQKFSNSLMIMSGDTPQSLDTGTLADVKYWAFYYSASWCPPCRAFTPELVNFYNSFKPSHPNFELIFVDDDRDQDAMLRYMRTDAMPWPAIWFADIDNPELEAKKYCGPGIPCLVLVDDRGRILADTMRGGQYTDPRQVIEDIRAIVQ